MCATTEYPGVSREAIRLRHFLYTLRDSAREWLGNCPPQSITTWNQLSQKFLSKYFPLKRIAKLRDEITAFQQMDSECYSEAWERYKVLLCQCPQHGLQKWLQVQYFYIGLNPTSRANVDFACDGSITKRTTDQLAALAKKVDQMNAIQIVRQKCKHRGGNHESVDCIVGSPFAQSLEDVNYAQNFQRQQHNQNPNTYYPDWRNHSSFQWSNNQGAQIAPQQTAPPSFQQAKNKFSLEDLITKLVEISTRHMQRTNKTLQVQGAAIWSLEDHMGQIAKTL
ncbi:uncharacterized protein LOC111383715 [Olea europaea var. sylvestris]|uniref:uncharacterized protein LOC111383715 n=1 Tax=Olea europaea var. sylvestris TaxID=158386 RepID=UPI000C1CE473|nr:uncharacterized protein LOC111383715 [Olea europaea var. sylvestris]